MDNNFNGFPVLKPEGSIEPEPEKEAFNEAMEQDPPTQTDRPNDEPTSSQTMDEADQDTGSGKEAKNKNRRMNIIGWINEKVKEKHQKSIEKSLKREAEFGHKLFSKFQQVIFIFLYSSWIWLF